jgi:hypothetical protein
VSLNKARFQALVPPRLRADPGPWHIVLIADRPQGGGRVGLRIPCFWHSSRKGRRSRAGRSRSAAGAGAASAAATVPAPAPASAPASAPPALEPPVALKLLHAVIESATVIPASANERVSLRDFIGHLIMAGPLRGRLPCIMPAMRARLAGILCFSILLASVGWTRSAWADIPPSPERPRDWNEYPAPLPQPPPEKEELAYRVMAAVAFALVAGAGLEALRRKRAALAMRAPEGR